METDIRFRLGAEVRIDSASSFFHGLCGKVVDSAPGMRLVSLSKYDVWFTLVELRPV